MRRAAAPRRAIEQRDADLAARQIGERLDEERLGAARRGLGRGRGDESRPCPGAEARQKADNDGHAGIMVDELPARLGHESLHPRRERPLAELTWNRPMQLAPTPALRSSTRIIFHPAKRQE